VPPADVLDQPDGAGDRRGRVLLEADSGLGQPSDTEDILVAAYDTSRK